MTPIEELLRSALQATPISESPDPVAAVDRRVRRARRRLALTAGAAAVIIAAAVVVPLVTLGGTGAGPDQITQTPPATSSSPSTEPSSSPPPGTVTEWPVDDAMAVAVTSDGTVWSVLEVERTNSIDWFVIRQDEQGRELERFPLPGPLHSIAAAGSTVWAYGGGDGAYSDGVLYAISTSGHVASHRYTNNGVRGIAPGDGDAWVTVSPDNRVDRVQVSGDRIEVVGSAPLPSQPREIVATRDGHLWVYQDLTERIVEIVNDSGSLHVGDSFPWSRGMFGPTGHSSYWTSDCRCRVVQIDPGLMASGGNSIAYGLRLGTPGDPTILVEDDAGGLYVATAKYDDEDSRAGVAYYAPQKGGTYSLQPTAFYPYRPYISALAPSPTGGVIIVSRGERVWDPAGS